MNRGPGREQWRWYIGREVKFSGVHAEPARQHPVEHETIEPLALDAFQPLGSVCRGGDVVIGRPESALQTVPDLTLILNDQDFAVMHPIRLS
jgi:hypothetical protein